jgi:hypothetical protein
VLEDEEEEKFVCLTFAFEQQDKLIHHLRASLNGTAMDPITRSSN